MDRQIHLSSVVEQKSLEEARQSDQEALHEDE
jgi:hypothetical protein